MKFLTLIWALVLPFAHGQGIDPNSHSILDEEITVAVAVGPFNTGDVVILLEDNPAYCQSCGGAQNLLAGRIGIVVCASSLILVSWNNWEFGHDGFDQCRPSEPITNSGWFVTEPQIQHLDLPDWPEFARVLDLIRLYD